MSKVNSVSLKMTSVGSRPVYWLMGALLFITNALAIQAPVFAGSTDVVVYKSPSCGCCADWVSHLKQNGFSVEVHNQRDMRSIKEKMGVPGRLQSCHTAKVGGYIIEGHVPAVDITRLIKNKPKIKGLAVPGMPMGSPGMDGPRKDAYNVLTFQASGEVSIYSRQNQ